MSALVISSVKLEVVVTLDVWSDSQFHCVASWKYKVRCVKKGSRGGGERAPHQPRQVKWVASHLDQTASFHNTITFNTLSPMRSTGMPDGIVTQTATRLEGWFANIALASRTQTTS